MSSQDEERKGSSAKMAEGKEAAKAEGETSAVSFTAFFSFRNLCSLLQTILRACARFLGLPCPTSPDPGDQDSSKPQEGSGSSQPQQGDGKSSAEAESAVTTGESKPPKKKGVSDGGKGGGQHN